jgi:hypothetical protein
MDRSLIKLNETLEKINENLVLLRDAISSGVVVKNDLLNVLVTQASDETYNVRLHDLEEAGKLDVAVCNCVQVDTNT